MKRAGPPGVGLGGDGDEIDAIYDVEASFGVKLEYGDASNWRTAGDVYRSLLNALPPEEAGKPDIWDRFVQALTQQTGADPKSIQPDSLLLGAAAGTTKLALITVGVIVAIVVGAAILFS